MENTRQATWSRIGSDIGTAKTIEDALRVGKLNFEVELQQVQLPNGNPISGKFATVRTDTNDVFGIVSDNYKICQNEQAFDFVQYIPDVTFVKAGITNTRGGISYIIASLPETSVMGDPFTPYVIFQNSFDGSTSIKTTICPLRIICQNQFNISFKHSSNTISLTHTGNLEEKLAEAKEVLSATAAHVRGIETLTNELSAIKIAGKEERLIEILYPIHEDSSAMLQTRQDARRQHLLTAYNADDNANFIGTAWGMVNAFADHMTHQLPAERHKGWEETRFIQSTLKGADKLPKFIELVRAA